MRTLLLAMFGLVVSAAAHAGGGGGVTLSGAYLPKYEIDDNYDAPGGFGCVGGIGYGVGRTGFRLGGEGIACRGRPGVRMGYGGLQIGFHRGVDRFWWSAHSGIGMGALHDRTALAGDYDALFGYLKPGVSFGVALGFTAIEFEVHALAPLNLVQWVGEGSGRGLMTPSAGAGVTFLFGNFHTPRRTAWSAPAVQDPMPLAIPGPSSPHPEAPRTEAPPDGTLAIPADEASYPPPPPASDDGRPLAIPLD